MASRSPAGTRGGRVTDAEYQALAQFRRALRSFLYFSEAAAREEGLTPAQYQLLLAIRGADGGGPPSIGDVADSLKLRHHSAVELVNRAESAGLLRRTPDENDRRRQLLLLTGLGQSKLDGLVAAHREELRRLREEGLTSLWNL